MVKGTTVTVIVIAAVLIVVAIQWFQFTSFKERAAGLVSGGAVAGVDMSDWTADEKMNYEMHGTIPARAAKGSTPTGVSMVGGC